MTAEINEIEGVQKYSGKKQSKHEFFLITARI